MFDVSRAVELWIVAGIVVLGTMLLMSMLARLYRKAGPTRL